MPPDELLLMGRFGRAHGIKGEVKVYPETDAPDRFNEIERVFVGRRRETAEPMAVEGARFQFPKGGAVVVLLKLEGVDDRDAAQDLTGAYVYGDPADMPLEDGEVFLHDIAGFIVVQAGPDDEALSDERGSEEPAAPPGTVYGTVRDVLDSGGGQLFFAVTRKDGTEILVPDVPAIVREVDPETERVLVTPPAGLFDL